MEARDAPGLSERVLDLGDLGQTLPLVVAQGGQRTCNAKGFRATGSLGLHWRPGQAIKGAPFQLRCIQHGTIASIGGRALRALGLGRRTLGVGVHWWVCRDSLEEPLEGLDGLREAPLHLDDPPDPVIFQTSAEITRVSHSREDPISLNQGGL